MNFIKESQTIETINFDKYTFTIYNRENITQYINKPIAVFYSKATPKAKYMPYKKIAHIVFATIEAAKEYVEKQKAYLKKVIADRQERKEKQRAANAAVLASDHFQIGSIVHCSWGYDQTQCDYYQVIKMTKKTITVKAICNTIVKGSEGMDCCDMMPDIDNFAENAETLTLRVYAGGNLSSINGYQYPKKWDGKAKYCSWYR